MVQEFSFNHAIFATGAFWQNNLYIAGVGGPLQEFALNPATSQFTTNPAASSSVPTSFGFPGATPSISTAGTTAGTTFGLGVKQQSVLHKSVAGMRTCHTLCVR